MVAIEVFRSLGVSILVRPVLEHITEYMEECEIEDEILQVRTHSRVGSRLAELSSSGIGGDNYSLAEIYAWCQPGASVHEVHVNCISYVTLLHLFTCPGSLPLLPYNLGLSVILLVSIAIIYLLLYITRKRLIITHIESSSSLL
jgi:hypothetical protein